VKNTNKKINIRYRGKDYEFIPPVKGTELAKSLLDKESSNVVAVVENNHYIRLSDTVCEDAEIDFVFISSIKGMRVYTSSLFLVLLKAFYELFPNGDLIIDHSISKGYYCFAEIGRVFDARDVKNLKSRMLEFIKKDIPIKNSKMEIKDARELFKNKGYFDTYELLKFRSSGEINVYHLMDNCEFYAEPLLPSTGYLKDFDIRSYSPGFIVQVPYYTLNGKVPTFVEERKLFTIFRETFYQNRIIGINNVVELNNAIEDGKISDIIKISEAFHEKKIQDIAGDIASRRNFLKFVLISGPSSSGKTTFSKRLSIALMLYGIKTITISLDDYFLDREKTPRDENGNYDYESFYALDLELFNDQIFSLLRGDEVTLPKFNFKAGKKEPGRKIKLEKDQMLVIEGIHGLNPKLTEQIPGYLKFNIYVSALTQLNLDYHHRMPTTDARILRRIVRDNLFRGHSALATIKMWGNVRKGEDRNIFPFQENADVMFNSALSYELAVLKKKVESLLLEIDDSNPEYPEAQRLLEFLSFFKPINDREIPPTSILREFIGGSSFKY